MNDIYLPNKTNAGILLLLFAICERRGVQLREAEKLPQELTTARPFMRAVPLHCTCELASLLALRAGPPFAVNYSHELPTPDIFISTRAP